MVGSLLALVAVSSGPLWLGVVGPGSDRLVAAVRQRHRRTLLVFVSMFAGL